MTGAFLGWKELPGLGDGAAQREQAELLRELLWVVQGEGRGADGVARLAARPPGQVVDSLLRHRLWGLWVASPQSADPRLAAVTEALAARRRYEVARGLQQEAMLRRASAVLNEAGVRHAFYKAAHLRRLIYPVRAHRPADDVDVLIDAAKLQAARAALLGAGFERFAKPHPTHEESYRWREGGVDLHWRPFRPGRARFDWTARLLEARRELDGVPMLTLDHELLMLLLGTALGDYVTRRLIRAIDIDRMVRQLPLDWQAIVAEARELGLATAAWCTLTWVVDWMDTPIPEWVWPALQPSGRRREYLKQWLRRDPSSLYARWPLLSQVGFSLALQDSRRDILRAARSELARRLGTRQLRDSPGATGAPADIGR